MEIHFCDRCQSSIPEQALLDDSALSVADLFLCFLCRSYLSAEGGGQALLCEACHQSVSFLGSVDCEGRVEGNRFLCSRCLGSLTRDNLPGEENPGPDPIRLSSSPAVDRGSLKILLAVVFILLVGGVLVATQGNLIGERSLIDPGGSSGSTRGRPSLMVPAHEEQGKVLESVQDRLLEISTEVSALGSPSDLGLVLLPLRTSLLEIGKTLDSLEAQWQSEHALSRLRWDEQGARDRAMEAVSGRLDERLSVIEEQLLEAKKIGIARSEAPGTTMSESPGFDEVLGRLSSSEAGIRFSSIVDLTRRRDPRAVPHLRGLLGSETDRVVRQQLARSLAVFGDKEAIPELLAALSDGDEDVRIVAAESLRVLTGEDFGYTWKASAGARLAALSRWKQWWSRQAQTKGQ